MKNVLVLGATGGIGHWVVKLLCSESDVTQTVYVRNPGKLDTELAVHVTVVQGDVLDTENLTGAMQGKDIVVAALSGDWLGQAKSIVAAMRGLPISHVFWVTGLGIHREVPGNAGKVLEHYAKRFPEYIQAADTIANCGVPYTLVRAANLMNGDNMAYYVQQEGEPLHGETVDRCAVAKYIADCVTNTADLSKSASVGITN